MVLADYRQGMLTLVADRAPLKKVMALIASKTGATIDVAPELWSELVVAKLGPATANEIVSTLLDGPKIDYFILGSNTQGGIQRVVVRRKQGFGRQPMAMAAAARPAENTANQAPGEAAQEQAQAQTPSDESTPAQDGPPPAR
jgi:hypothetical protein